MTNYLIRRSLQMLIVLFFAALATFTLLNLAPGGPWEDLLSQQQTAARRITAEDIARIRAQYELDLFLPYRFTRWLIGVPNGPIKIAGQTYFADAIVGCRMPQTVLVIYADGTQDTMESGCRPGQDVTLADLEGRRVSRGVIFGDFGLSWGMLRDRPVVDVLWSRIPRTLQLMITALLIALAIGIPLGLISAVRQYSVFDYIVTTLAFIGSSMPTFFFGILMILFFSILPNRAGWFFLPPGDAIGSRDYTIPGLGLVDAGSLLDQTLRMIMPTTVLVIVNIAQWSRFIRSSMLEVLRQDYVRTARAKGLLENVVIVKHAFRNALIPFVTIAVLSVVGTFGGAILTETVFNWPGMGRLFIDALQRADYPVSMAIFLISAFLTVVATLVGDVLYTLVDPRIRLT